MCEPLLLWASDAGMASFFALGLVEARALLLYLQKLA